MNWNWPGADSVAEPAIVQEPRLVLKSMECEVPAANEIPDVPQGSKLQKDKFILGVSAMSTKFL